MRPALLAEEEELITTAVVVQVALRIACLASRAIQDVMSAGSAWRRPGAYRRVLCLLILAGLLCASIPQTVLGSSPEDPFDSARQNGLPGLTRNEDPEVAPADDEGLSVEWNCPPFLRSGDSFSPSVTLYNHQELDLLVHSTLDAEGIETQGDTARMVNIPAGSEKTLTWQMSTSAAPTGQLTLNIRGENDEGSQEISKEVSLQILPGGSQQRVEQRGRVWVREWLISHLNYGATQVNSLVWISPSMLAMLLKDYNHWEGVPYKNNDQAANLLLLSTTLWKAFSEAGAHDIPEARPVRTDLVRAAEYLMSQQNTDGGWGWWPGDESRPFQTAQVLHVLFEADATGLTDIPSIKETMGLEALRRYWNAAEDLELRAYLLYVISQRRFDDKGLSTYELWWERRKLSTPALAYLGMALDNMDALPVHRRTDIMNTLKRRASQTEHFVWWQTAEGQGQMPGGDRFGTAMALQAFLRWSASEELVGMSFDWLLRTGTSPTERIDFATAQSIVTLAQAKHSQEPVSEGVVRVALEGIPVFEGQVDNQDLLRVDEVVLSDLRPGSNWIEILLEWPGPLYFDWTLQYILADGELDAAHSSGGIILNRRYLDAQEEALAIEYETGGFVLVQLETETEETLYHVVIEDALPAGCRPVMGSLQSKDMDHSGLETSVYGDQVRFFLPELPEGKHVFTYLLRADTPGQFLAVPATAYLAHNPSRWGQSGGEQITVLAPAAE